MHTAPAKGNSSAPSGTGEAAKAAGGGVHADGLAAGLGVRLCTLDLYEVAMIALDGRSGNWWSQASLEAMGGF